MRHRNDPDGLRLPIKLDATSNGEFAPVPLDTQLARSALDRQEFVFDVQSHFVNPTGAWTRALPPGAQPLKSFTELKGCSAASAPGLGYLECLGSDAYIKDIFLDSDTDLVV